MYILPRRAKFVSSLLPITALLLLLFFTFKPLKHDSKTSQNKPLLHISKHLQLTHSTCEGTLYPELCFSTLSSIPNLSQKSIPQIISSVVDNTVRLVKSSAVNCTRIRQRLRKLDQLQKRALDDCLELFDYTVYDLNATLSDLSTTSTSAKHYNDLQTLFSAAMTNQYTCLDGFAHGDHEKVRKLLMKGLNKITHSLSNSLVMLKKIPNLNKSESEYGKMVGGFPGWMSRKDRHLLQTPVEAIKFDLVVAKDGSGNFTTITDAVNAAPNSTKRFVIHIKAGGYFENVEVVKKKQMIMFVGDGLGKTVIKASRNAVDGWTTYQSATLAVVGDGFIARDLTVENAAGPYKHQAVALRSTADQSAFYRCSFVGYQDTLYVHTYRQFYKDCDIYGTIDFIFGNAAAVLQNCNLYARRPNPNQQNIFTAQGREDCNQNTGISIISCKVAAAADLLPVKSQFKTYLGRPWKNCSRTVFINSQLDDLVDPKGWLEWNGTFALDTLYYGEYMNRGPGSNTSNRVTWPGYRVINSSAEASQFTVANFLQGDQWLPSYKIPYFSGLSKQ
ncbi:Pectinesterase/pectinesterase inhibitor [Thalictrum thalictroides]|uniref:Pectinesterase n=1 Tax=Thalictrum thalictroides TaxID=46969 RepID=A0A7J6V2F1_THATH|nr:Pectinesterase/pectinesterase inhibitor [Thalictrum thalictroides]